MTAVDRCDLTDLLPEQCACKNHRNSPELDDIDMAEISIERYFTARFDSRCALYGKHPIREGERAALTTAGVVCSVCIDAINDTDLHL